MTTKRHLDHLRADSNYRRERLEIYRAKAYSGRPTSAARLAELTREYELAVSRLKRATEAPRAED